ncbi:MAG TPA: RNA 2'-phosphotransferase [Panacibacter sp.]|nr:RNA 2'-phosphotransferase [Panacibacter sp.]
MTAVNSCNDCFPRGGHHVHLCADKATAIKVAERRGKPIILEINTAEMFAAGYTFYLSANGVWLTDYVPVEYIDRF